MNCSRCRGLMTQDHFMDYEGTTGFMWMAGWRCLNCGHIDDPVIEQNRRLPRPVVQTVPCDEPAADHDDVLEVVQLESESFMDRAA